MTRHFRSRGAPYAALVDVLLQGLINIGGRSFLSSVKRLGTRYLGCGPDQALEFCLRLHSLDDALFCYTENLCRPVVSHRVAVRAAARTLVNAAAFSLNAVV